MTNAFSTKGWIELLKMVFIPISLYLGIVSIAATTFSFL